MLKYGKRFPQAHTCFPHSNISTTDTVYFTDPGLYFAPLSEDVNKLIHHQTPISYRERPLANTQFINNQLFIILGSTLLFLILSWKNKLAIYPTRNIVT